MAEWVNTPGGGGYVQNPLSDIIDGMLRGHQMALQLQQNKRAEQEHLTNQALANQKMSMQDILNRQMLGESARPVTDMGTVESPAGPEIPSNVPGMPASPGAPSYQRKADSSRTVKYGGKQYELLTPEEQQARAQNSQINGMQALEAAKARVAEDTRRATLQLEGGGIPAQGLGIIGIPDGSMLTRDEAIKYTEAADAKKRANLVNLAPGASLVDVSGTMNAPSTPATPEASAGSGFPGGQQPDAIAVPPNRIPGLPANLQPSTRPAATPAATAAPGGHPGPMVAPGVRVIAGGGQPNPTGDFERVYLPAFAKERGKTVQQLDPHETMEAVQQYAQRSKDPTTMALAHALTQLHIDQARQNMANQGGQGVAIQPGTAMDRVANDLASGKLTMSQFRTLYGYSRNVGQKLAIYDRARELNPNFNPSAFEMGYNFAKNPKVMQQMASLDNVEKGIPDLLKISDQADRTGVPLLNRWINKGGYNIAGKHYANLAIARTAFADELSGALGYGSATDMSREMGLNMTDPNLSPADFRDAITNVVQPFLQRKRASMLGPMGVYGQPGGSTVAPGGQAGRTVNLNPNGPQWGGDSPGQGAGSFSVTDPRGVVHTFPTQQQANQFKQAIGQ
jgi:hypothetical protein